MLVERVACEVGDVLYVSGSTLEGFGNPRSDLDLFLLTHSVENFMGRSRDAVTRFGGKGPGLIVLPGNPSERTYDIEIHSFTSLERIIRKLADDNDALESMDAAYALALSDLNFLHRLRIGVALYGAETLDALRARVPFERLRSVLAARRLTEYDKAVEDALGALEGRQLETAVWNARHALECAFDAYLASRGETYVSPKWKFEKARRLLGTEHPLFQQFWTFECNGPLEDRETSAWVDGALRLGQRLAIDAAAIE